MVEKFVSNFVVSLAITIFFVCLAAALGLFVMLVQHF